MCYKYIRSNLKYSGKTVEFRLLQDHYIYRLTFEEVESIIEATLLEEKGTGCNLIDLDPFSEEVTKFERRVPFVVCEGQDWVKCYLSKCKVVDAILRSMVNIKCIYRDIIFVNDDKQYLAPKSEVDGSDEYELIASDHVKISCHAKPKNGFFPKSWSGFGVGYRRMEPQTSPDGRKNNINVMILAFDSTSRSGFIRRMPLSYKALTQDLKAVVMNGYNIVGDATLGALFPILTGRSEIELPNVMKGISKEHLDDFPFIFHELKDDGYRTAYFEDMPWIGTFQYRLNGFLKQPADHYTRPLFMEQSLQGHRWFDGFKSKYCFGDRPYHELMLNITEQFFELDSKKYCFTFISGVCHDDFSMASVADVAVFEFLERFKAKGHLEDTLLIVMGDHGSRFGPVRQTLQGKLEERLPFMAISLPWNLLLDRPDSIDSLNENAYTLTTPFDIHSTVLDAIGLGKFKNPYTIPGADYPRALSLLETIPRSRSCSEAGIEPHWCTCVQWKNVSESDAVYHKAAEALLAHINWLTQEFRSMCVARTLLSISWVTRRSVKRELMNFGNQKTDESKSSELPKKKQYTEHVQIMVVLGPGKGVFEASMLLLTNGTQFRIDTKDISRVSKYDYEPDCISETYPHLNKFCYCVDYLAGMTKKYFNE